MRNKIFYEWTREILDENRDIIDSDFSDTLASLVSKEDLKERFMDIGLVRNEGNETEDLINRHWAYLKDGKLPAYFSDDLKQTAIKVPIKFHKELSNFLNS